MGEETLETANLDNYLKGLCFKQEQEMWQGLHGTVVEKGSLAEENKPCRSYSPKYLQTPFATDAVPYMHREAQAVQAAGLLWRRRRAAAGLCRGTCT
ncbi:hypothetical protein H8959_001979 [Pygathrix nigripes]